MKTKNHLKLQLIIKKFRKNFEINENEKPSQITINNKKINSFDSYLKYRKNEIHDYQKNLALLNNIRKLFSNGANKEDWLSNLNIGNIMYLSPLNYSLTIPFFSFGHRLQK